MTLQTKSRQASREITPYIRLRSEFAMIKKRSGDGAGPAMDREDIYHCCDSSYQNNVYNLTKKVFFSTKDQFGFQSC